MRLLELRHVWRYAECRTGCCNLGNEVFKGSCSSFVSFCLPCALLHFSAMSGVLMQASNFSGLTN